MYVSTMALVKLSGSLSSLGSYFSERAFHSVYRMFSLHFDLL